METKIEIGIWRIRRYEERKNMNADFRIDGKVIETKRLILDHSNKQIWRISMSMHLSKVLGRWQDGNIMKILLNLKVS